MPVKHEPVLVKLIAGLIIGLLVLANSNLTNALPEEDLYELKEIEELEEEITATSACLVDVKTGRVLYEQNSHKQLPMASTTKVMTALLSLERGNLNEVVTASEAASEVEGSSIYLQEDEQLTLEAMLYGLMLESGNDAAHAIAEHIDGDIESFARNMTDRAESLGAKNTNFQNPHGLPSDNHYSTAYDMTIIAKEALKKSKFAEIVSTKEKLIPWEKGDADWRYLNNDNKLLDELSEADGVKTGWTEAAGRCLIFSGTKDERQVVGTVLKAPKMYQDAENLLEYGIYQFNEKQVIQKGQLVREVPVEKGKYSTVPVVAGSEIVLPLESQEYRDLNYHIKIPKKLQAPLEKGEEIGTLQILSGKCTLAETELLTSKEVDEPFYRRFLP
ncbi:D-alanyl-D-alanine carboxypeptidase family protein [Natranaerobius thermophilus]|uniref:serine-type D-Ala-D-Ala carboxypeptidase n=1 Tax=Natranaerobius thermophilus (strain ATCC BAA-1301 / DSM 18059 / JW/NM-WN-LF) TaxID=457570 RepID=B2A4K0_NATTJ|nr:D-alanyl-D-alanine carboxypeptidase family protein [Natranaerobius thermophilus]ACB85222.1 Serine-type D-Ala-D-Ala carboxypeptidase [Natranaerobius thermophilus JW/NM-WN-LF]